MVFKLWFMETKSINGKDMESNLTSVELFERNTFKKFANILEWSENKLSNQKFLLSMSTTSKLIFLKNIYNWG